jgi:hypothetical protein
VSEDFTVDTIRKARLTGEAWGHDFAGGTPRACSDDCRLCALLDAAEVGLFSAGPGLIPEALGIVRGQ